MTTLKKLFTPLEEVNKTTMRTVYVMQGLFVLALWTFAVPDHSIFPNFSKVLAAWGELWSNGLFSHIMATLTLCTVSTVIAVIVSSIIAYSSEIPFFQGVAWLASKLRYNPIQGFTVFLTIATGGGRILQIALLVIFMSFYFVGSLLAIIADIPIEDKIRRRAQRMNGWQILWKVVIRDRADYLIQVVGINLAMSLMMIVSVEGMDKSQGGLGALLLDTGHGMNFPKILALQATITLIGIGLDTLMRAWFHSFPSNKKSNEK